MLRQTETNTCATTGNRISDANEGFDDSALVAALARVLGPQARARLGILTVARGFCLSVVIPVYNERQWILEIIRRVKDVPVPMEIIVVDDFSTDGTREMLRKLDEPSVRVIFHERNQGKGAALRTGFAAAAGDVVLVQDADLEYDPADYPQLLQPILDGRADVVFGSRFIGESHRVLYFWHSIANRMLTTISNMFTNLNLTDMETCYKVFRREVIDHVQIKSNRFGFEPEITAKVARGKWRIFEVPISYSGRTYEEGTKIGLKDAFHALYCILRFSFID
jgi:glycosyltransferase involved in cell wall biosynthesis